VTQSQKRLGQLAGDDRPELDHGDVAAALDPAGPHDHPLSLSSTLSAVAGQGQHLLQLSIWDLPAGLTTAVVEVLQALAYASVAGLPVRRLCRATRRSAERPSFASWCVRTGEQVTHPDVPGGRRRLRPR